MPLTSRQKKYIKKHYRNSSTLQLAGFLKIPHDLVLDYLGKRGIEVKAKSDVKEEPNFSLKTFLKSNWLSLLTLTILASSVYANSLGNAFLSDDLPEIVNNPNIGNLGYAITNNPSGFIRLVLYWIAFQINSLNPAIFRLINIFFHIGNVALFYILILLLMKNKQVAFFSSALFAIHPLLAEPVVWISGGGYPQYTFFFLLSFLFYMTSTKHRVFYLLSPIFYLLSFMSHPQMPASLVLIYPLYEFIFGNLRKHWTKTIPFVFILVIYLVLNFAAVPAREQTLQSVHYQEKGVDNLFVLVPVAITSYLNLIFYPKDLTLYHSELSLGLFPFILTVIEFLVFLTGLILLFIKRRQIFFWVALFFISLLPTLTPFRLNWIVAERYVYLGSIGVFVPIVYFLDKLLFKKGLKLLFYIVLILLSGAFSARTFMRNIDWKNEDNLWIATGKTSPSSPNTHNNLGDVYGRQGNKQASIAEFKRAIEIKPNYADAYHNLGNAYHDSGQDQLALENYQKAASYNPNLWQSYQNIAAISFSEKKYDKALESMQKAININPKNIQLHYNLGIIYLALGQKDKAREVFQLILSVDPQNKYALAGLAEAEKK